MAGPASATPRFLYRFARPGQDVAHEREVCFEVDGTPRPATAYLPDEHDGHRPMPAWVLLQGITVPGRHHAGVRRMARAVAAAGHLALVPEVPSWTALRVDPGETEPTLSSALSFLARCRHVDPDRIGVMGFSVAATWLLGTAAGGLKGRVRGVVSVGGYADFRRMLVAMAVGEHEWGGRQFRYTPDPYGRWILGANLLPLLDGGHYGNQQAREIAAAALHRLAHTAGRNGALARTPVYDDLIAQLRETIPPGVTHVWDLLAPRSRSLVPDAAAGRELACELAAAGVQRYPEFDPIGRLHALEIPVVLLHGRNDTLVPFSETLRLAAAIPPSARRDVTVTPLLGHAKMEGAATPWRDPAALAGETRRFVGAIHRLLSMLEDHRP
jgi:dienelactone hydrolase